ncbi:MAG: hypothetical protein DRN92_00695 [Thermoproteota archaeon]|nr:MAG: hypothetical protein DRN92_00695 [Candidatus Korarchaeota archaeon]
MKSVSRREVGEKITSLISNSIKLALILVFLSFLRRQLQDSVVEAFNLQIPSKLIVDAIRLAAIAYFGQKVVVSLLFLLNIISDRLSKILGFEKTGGLKRIGNDIIYMIGLLLAWFGLSPLFAFLPGKILGTILSVVFLMLAALIVYDALRTGYDLFKEKFDRFVSQITFLITGIPEDGESKPNQKKGQRKR